jgi:CDP-glucose 4,6-dehydratase
VGSGQSSLEGVELNSRFWHGKRVLVTGHTGFKGAWLSEWLVLLGARVSGYALAPPTEPALFDQLGLAGRVKHRLGDIGDLSALQKCVRDAEPEIVFHLAAQSLVRRSYRDPLETYRSNVMGTAHLLEACRGVRGLRSIVVITTDKCYENREWYWAYRENEALGGYDPYSSSKACAELVTASYRQTFFNPDAAPDVARVASARAGNVIGGGDWADNRLIPDVVRACSHNRAVLIRYPDAIRPWQHVLEPLRGYLMLAERLFGEQGSAWAEAWNFGPREDDAQSVRWVLERFAALWPKVRWQQDDAEQPHEAGVLKLDCSKARMRLGWQQKLSLPKALQLTVEWYQTSAAGGDLAALTRRQIGEYMAAINGSSE